MPAAPSARNVPPMTPPAAAPIPAATSTPPTAAGSGVGVSSSNGCDPRRHPGWRVRVHAGHDVDQLGKPLVSAEPGV